MKYVGIDVHKKHCQAAARAQQGIAIVRFLEGEMTSEKTTYGFFVRCAGDVYSIYIQFIEQPQITS